MRMMITANLKTVIIFVAASSLMILKINFERRLAKLSSKFHLSSVSR